MCKHVFLNYQKLIEACDTTFLSWSRDEETVTKTQKADEQNEDSGCWLDKTIQ